MRLTYQSSKHKCKVEQTDFKVHCVTSQVDCKYSIQCIAPMVKELAERSGRVCSTSLFAITCIECLVHENSKGCIVVCPRWKWHSERAVLQCPKKCTWHHPNDGKKRHQIWSEPLQIMRLRHWMLLTIGKRVTNQFQYGCIRLSTNVYVLH